MTASDVIWCPVSRIIRDFLIEKEVGVLYDPDADWPIAIAACPKRPINVITVYDEDAMKKGRGVYGGVTEDPTVTIEIRCDRPETGQMKAKEILAEMDGLQNWGWEGDSDDVTQTVLLGLAHRARGIFNLGQDESGYWRFNMEYRLVVVEVDGELPAPESSLLYWIGNYWL